MDPLDMVMRYHQETKHQLSRSARSLGYLDWANQPNPFRRFDGAVIVPLPILEPEDEPRSPQYDDLYLPCTVPSAPVSLRTLSRLFEYAHRRARRDRRDPSGSSLTRCRRPS